MRASRLVLTLCVLFAAHVQSYGQNLNHDNDHVLNAKGQSRITFATGIPYIAVGEYAYGFSDRVTVGILWGLTPRVEGYGLRARAVLYEPTSDFRIYFCTPILFYPKTITLGGDAWWLARPNINFEWIAQSGIRYKTGGSLIVAASHHVLFGDPSNAKFPPGAWTAIHGGISLPISNHWMFQCETSLVMKGLQVAGSEWIGGPPVIFVMGVSYVY
jgi:hypothetical protein